MFSVVVFLSLALLAQGFEEMEASDSRIINGEDAEPGKYPHQVSIQKIKTGQHFCGGSIIDENYVLTAAHCTDGEKAKELQVMCGSNLLSKPGPIYKVLEIMMHEKYDNKKYTSDIAILKVDTIKFTKLVAAILMRRTDTVADEKFVETGWGAIQYPYSRYPDKLQKLYATAFDLKKCQEIHKNYGPWGKALGPSQQCVLAKKTRMINITNYGNSGACRGDSGGPLVDMNGTLSGATSWGYPCASGKPDVFTKIFAFIDWILKKIGKNPSIA